MQKTHVDKLVAAVHLARAEPAKIAENLRRVVFGPFLRASLRSNGVILRGTVRLYGAPIVKRYRGSRIIIGDGCELRSRSKSHVLGLAHPVVLTTMANDALIDIDADVGLSGTTICAAQAITIGPRTLVGADVLITDNDHHALTGERRRHSLQGVGIRPISIGADVFIGARSIILKGVTIGSGAVVGAGSVVTLDVPSGALAAGNPAQIIGSVSEFPTAR